MKVFLKYNSSEKLRGLLFIDKLHLIKRMVDYLANREEDPYEIPVPKITGTLLAFKEIMNGCDSDTSALYLSIELDDFNSLGPVKFKYAKIEIVDKESLIDVLLNIIDVNYIHESKSMAYLIMNGHPSSYITDDLCEDMAENLLRSIITAELLNKPYYTFESFKSWEKDKIEPFDPNNISKYISN